MMIVTVPATEHCIIKWSLLINPIRVTESRQFDGGDLMQSLQYINFDWLNYFWIPRPAWLREKAAAALPQSSVWPDAPELAIPDLPALLGNSIDLWLGYAMAHTPARRYAIIQFIDVTDHRLSPINDEGLGSHPYAKAGLQWYTFNEISGSRETIKWSALQARHWVVTFKDNTLDVLAGDAKVVARDVESRSPMSALIDYLRSN